jgi:outer membrane cobalamin receptor
MKRPRAEERMAVASYRSIVPLLSAILLAACHTAGARPKPPDDQAYHAHVITSDEIARSGCTDAWEVLKRFSTTARTTETADGTPQRLHPRRGHGSLMLQDDPVVYIDGVPLSDLRALRQMGAEDIDTIEEMGSIEATAFYGTNSNAGVILIHSRTRAASRS